MTTIDGMPISSELAAFLKNYCPAEKGDETFLTAAITTISDIQDFICMKLGNMEDDEKREVSNYLNDIVLLKKDICQLVKLLPIVKEGGR